MARHVLRPLAAVDGGPVRTIGTGNVLGDGLSSTWKEYQEAGGSICTLPGSPAMPTAPVIAVSVGHVQTNGSDFWLYNGWVCSYIRYDGTREAGSRNYVQDGTRNGVDREIVGPPVYKPDVAPWSATDIARMSLECGAVEGSTGPGAQKYWCMAKEVFLIMWTADPVGVPTLVSPANNATLSTSSVNFSSNLTAQRAQPTRAVWQVARDSGFTQDVRTLQGNLVTGTGVKSDFVSRAGTESWTDLGPGRWYYRVRGRDFRGTESAWSATRQFDIVNAPLPSTTVAAPESGQTLFNPLAVRAATLREGSSPLGTLFASGLRVGVRWQFTKAADFSGGAQVEWLNLDGRWDSGMVDYDPEPVATLEPGKSGRAVSFQDPDQRLSQGTWRVRARAESKYGHTGTWSPTIAFTVSHAPTANGDFPTAGAAFDPETQLIRWRFVDPWSGDQQTAYRIVVTNDAGHVVHDTDWVASAITQGAIAPPSSYFDQHLHYQVHVRDIDGAEGAMPGRQSFLYARAPKVTILTPEADSNEASGQPAVTWSSEFFGGGGSQKAFRVQFFNLGDRVPTFDSGTITSAESSYTPPHAILKNMQQYVVMVQVTDQQGLVGVGTAGFLANFIRPSSVDTYASSASHAVRGYVVVEWSGEPDVFFETWRIYRRRSGAQDWTLVGTVADRSARTFQDWTASGIGRLDYAVVQVANRYGSLVEGDPDWQPTSVNVSDTQYWLIIPEASFGVPVLPTAHSITRTREKHVMDIIGRGKKVNYGQTLGGEGSLTIRVRHHNSGRTGQEMMELIEQVTLGAFDVILRDPFGDPMPVALGEYSFEREAGVGPDAMGELTIPYVEVIQ